jgi:hypothetical protein
MRIDAWFSMSVFFLRNIVVMSRQMDGERFLLIKSSIKLELVALERGAFGDDGDDENDDSRSISFAKSAIVTISPSTLVSNQPMVSVPISEKTCAGSGDDITLAGRTVPTAEPSRCIMPDPVGGGNNRVSRTASVSAQQPQDTSPGQPQQRSSPSPAPRNGWLATASHEANPTPSSSNVDHDSPESLLAIASAFSVETDSSLRPHEPMLGICMERMWTSKGFAAFSVLSLASCLALVSLRQPTTYFMLGVCYADVILITICGSALIDMRILRCLARTFEFWFLQTVMFIGFSVALFELSLMSDQMAAFEGTDPTIYFYGDVLWQCAGFIGSVVVVCFDALMVTRNVKLAFNIVWICNALRLFYQLLFDYSTRSYAYPITVRFAWESFCVQTIRVEVLCWLDLMNDLILIIED